MSASSETPEVRPWRAQILNSWMIGLGDTPQEALDALRRNLEDRRMQGPLPRPGTRQPLQWAAADQIARHGEFAYEFVERVTGIRPLLMTDQTSLHDFCLAADPEDVHRKTALLYRVDTRDLLAEPLWKVLDLVREREGR